MRLNRVFIGKYEPIRRPHNVVDASLLGRIQQAKQDLMARGKDVVSVREIQRSSPPALPTGSGTALSGSDVVAMLNDGVALLGRGAGRRTFP
jgi:hypothetical protein